MKNNSCNETPLQGDNTMNSVKTLKNKTVAAKAAFKENHPGFTLSNVMIGVFFASIAANAALIVHDLTQD